MANVKPLYVSEFQGGLNLRADAFNIGEDQSPDMLNIDVDPAGGFRTRRGHTAWKTVSAAVGWDPRTLHTHVLGSNATYNFLANDDTVFKQTGAGAFVDLAFTANAAPHGAAFTSWKDDLFIACGRSNTGRRWNGASDTVTSLTDPVGAWNDDYTAPGTNKMPKADLCAVHESYLWVASTSEGGTDYRDRVRWSHPNDPDSWASYDYIDFPEGDGPITALVPWRGQLLVFFEKSIWAIYGYSLDTFSKQNVSYKLGVSSSQAVVANELGVFFADRDEGVHLLNGETIDEISEPLRPVFDHPGWADLPTQQWLGWVGKRLWWSVPFAPDAVPSEPSTTFVYDPSLKSWVCYRGADGATVAPFANDGVHGCLRTSDDIVELEGTTEATDLDVGFETKFRTRWIHAGYPTTKKGWKRPDFVTHRTVLPFEVSLFVYHDYDSGDAKRTKLLTSPAGSNAMVWTPDPDYPDISTPPPGAPVWSEESTETGAWEWGPSPEGSQVTRTSSLGNARAVQLLFVGPVGVAWGLNLITFKYNLRRFR